MILLRDSEGSDQTAWMRRLIWVFAVHISLKTRFHLARLMYFHLSDPCLHVLNIMVIPSSLEIMKTSFTLTSVRHKMKFQVTFYKGVSDEEKWAQFNARSTADQEVVGSAPTGLAIFFHGD